MTALYAMRWAMESDGRGLSRRSVITVGAWAVPVMAVAVAGPLAAASTGGGGAINAVANYYWDADSIGDFTTLDPAQDGLRATFSTQISYQSDPWREPPEGASLIVVVDFDAPVRLEVDSDLGMWSSSPSPGSVGTSFSFVTAPAGFGGALTFNVIGTAPGPLTSTATMSLAGGGSTTWAQESSAETAVLVA